MTSEKIDPYKHKERYLKWRQSPRGRILELDKYNQELILRCLDDLELGLNISKKTPKGSRSYVRLNTFKDRLILIAHKLETNYEMNKITDLTEKDIHRFFQDMRNGILTRLDGKKYLSTYNYVEVFKSFWHWYMRIQKKEGNRIDDITEDLDKQRQKPKWVFLTENQIRRLIDSAKFDYKVLITFLVDSGVRSPTELINIKVSDLRADFKEIDIREEIVKKGSFGRKIKLIICSELLKKYVKYKNLTPNDYLFKISPPVVNRYLQRLAKRVLGEDVSPAGEIYSRLTMYDFRHNSACYWRPRYKHTQGILYRFGWKTETRLNYYTDFLGMRDTITEDDLLIGEEQKEIEKRLMKAEYERQMLQEKVVMLMEQMQKITSNIPQLTIN